MSKTFEEEVLEAGNVLLDTYLEAQRMTPPGMFRLELGLQSTFVQSVTAAHQAEVQSRIVEELEALLADQKPNGEGYSISGRAYIIIRDHINQLTTKRRSG